MLRAKPLNSTSLIAFTIFILLAGCTDLDNHDGIPSTTSTNTVEVSVSWTPIVHLSSPTATEFSPSVTPTFTPLQTKNKTPRPKSSSTWTPIPTLPRDEAIEAMLSLYKDNEGCQLPCWWGIYPGKTTWESARKLLDPIRPTTRYVVNSTLDTYTFYLEVSQDMHPLKYVESVLWVKDGFVRAIALNASWIKEDFDYSLSGILRTLGQPEEIWIKVNTDTMMDLPFYELDLFYPSKGILINSSGEARAVNDIAVTICPKEFRRGKFPPGILLWDPSHLYSYQEIGSDLLGGSRDIGGESFYLLRKIAFDFNEEDFYNAYKDPTINDCFDIDMDKLP